MRKHKICQNFELLNEKTYKCIRLVNSEITFKLPVNELLSNALF